MFVSSVYKYREKRNQRNCKNNPAPSLDIHKGATEFDEFFSDRNDSSSDFGYGYKIFCIHSI